MLGFVKDAITTKKLDTRGRIEPEHEAQPTRWSVATEFQALDFKLLIEGRRPVLYHRGAQPHGCGGSRQRAGGPTYSAASSHRGTGSKSLCIRIL